MVSQRSWVRIPCRPELFSGLTFTTASVVSITAMVIHKFVCFSAIQIYDLTYIYLHTEIQFNEIRVYPLTFPQCFNNLSLCFFTGQTEGRFQQVILSDL